MTLRTALLLTLTGFALSAFAAPASTTFVYDAYLGKMRVGVAQVRVRRDDTRFEIQGEAESRGLARAMTRWRSLFRAEGVIEETGPVVADYRREDRSRGKRLEIEYVDGHISSYEKNGKERPPFEPPAPMDLLSALFLSPECDDLESLHDGKDLWRLSLKHNWEVEPSLLEPTDVRGAVSHDAPGANRVCEFLVTDEDDEQSTAEVWLGQVGEFTVPLVVVFTGHLDGRLELVR